jgi:hypothetical protein
LSSPCVSLGKAQSDILHQGKNNDLAGAERRAKSSLHRHLSQKHSELSNLCSYRAADLRPMQRSGIHVLHYGPRIEKSSFRSRCRRTIVPRRGHSRPWGRHRIADEVRHAQQGVMEQTSTDDHLRKYRWQQRKTLEDDTVRRSSTAHDDRIPQDAEVTVAPLRNKLGKP